jgi:hypothetical protein
MPRKKEFTATDFYKQVKINWEQSQLEWEPRNLENNILELAGAFQLGFNQQGFNVHFEDWPLKIGDNPVKYAWKFMCIEYNEAFLFELENKLLKQYKIFKDITPKPIKLEETNEFLGKADRARDLIVLSSCFLKKNPTLKQVNDLLKHELLHFVCKTEYHGLSFLAKAKRLKIDDDYIRSELFNEEKLWLEGRFARIINAQSEEEIIDKKKPSFNRFSTITIGLRDFPLAVAYKHLREIYGLSVQEVSRASGISENEIIEIETDGSRYDIFTDKAALRKVFEAIVEMPKAPQVKK